jgi:3-oxoacyl-[acyl-carrier-protein] synthase-1/3-oxoacyl-[acyl-carrier-protein] synthase II
MISALGTSVPEAVDALHSGGGRGPEEHPLETSVSPCPPAFTVRAELGPGEDLTRTSKLALRALDEALANADLDPASLDPRRVGVCLGTTVGCSFNGEAFWRSYRRGDGPGLAAVDRYLANDLAPLVARRIGALGPAVTVVNACASGADAVGLGARWIASGRCDVVIAGGADELERFAFHGFLSLKNVSPTRCRPFDRRRDGLTLGEGAGILVLEAEDAAEARGAPRRGRILGYAAASDAHHPTAPHPQGRGLRQALDLALAGAGLDPRDVGFVCAHATATLENDRVEGGVLAEAFPAGTPVFSTKGCTGHTLGAAGAMEAILTLRGLADGRIPATAGLEDPDPECRVEPTRETTELDARSAVSTSLAFGGTNSALVMGVEGA